MMSNRQERRKAERTKKNTSESFEMQAEFLQPWSTFVMKTHLPPPVLEKMIDITDKLVENRESATSWGHDLAGQIEDEFLIEPEIIERENLMGVFMDACRTYIVQAYCQHFPFNKEDYIKEKWITEMTRMWIVSQKDNEYNPIHIHGACHLSAVMYLKIPEYLPVRKSHKPFDDGAITFTNNSSTDKIWGDPSLSIPPSVGELYIFPATQAHQVYPFRTADGKGERRSVSFNTVFSGETEQNRLKTQQQEKN
tara:strand:- start:37 stop:792 length:756 start_codon:yes stop_codon:yes gene_type:complete